MLLTPNRLWLLLLVLGTVLASYDVEAQTRLLRFPDIHGDRVVFSYGGDLWIAAIKGGIATRLTTHDGVERFPKFSPDGRWIAFTGQYDGDEQVYVIPSEGGIPRQLTFFPARGPLPPRWGYDHQVYGWAVDGSGILFRSLRDSWSLADGRLFVVSREGGLPVALPMPVAGAGDFSPDGGRLVYSPLFRDFRSWKRYEGGWAQDLFIFDLASGTASRITDHPRTERDPMWIGDKVYFASDRDGFLNLYEFDPATQETTQLTRERIWDVRWPSSDKERRIVYELNGELHVLDVVTRHAERIPITVPTDGVAMRPSRVPARELVQSFGLSPKGERALFVARGDVFSAPVEEGPTRNLTASSASHDKAATWSPDGRTVAFISDRSGEEEIYLVNQDGTGEIRQLTQGGAAMRALLRWSPDGRFLSFSDKDGFLYVLDVESRELQQVAYERRFQLFDYAWSPFGHHIAFSLNEPTGFRSIHIWSRGDGQVRRVTSEYFNDFNPAWDPEGNYLYFLSDREFAPQISSIEWNYAVSRETEIFALALRKDVDHPFPPKSDEVTIEEKPEPKDGEKKENEAQQKSDSDADRQLSIDFEGLAARVARVPVSAGNYGGLSTNRGHLIFVSSGPFFYGRESEPRPALQIFSIKDRKQSTLVEGITGGYALSFDGTKILVREGSDFNRYNAAPDGRGSKKTIPIAGLAVDRVPSQEWQQIFNEVWRRFRDFFYVENLHGYNWEALRRQYAPWLQHVAHRSDLNYVISEMIAELNVSHAYIAGGDFNIPSRPQVALLGARLELDLASGRYRIARIFRGQNEEERYRSPLTEIGVDAREGDYLLAIDGEPLTGTQNPYQMLRHKADRPVRLTLNATPDFEGAREVTIQPISTETNLIYLDWVSRNREWASEQSNGRVGYLHVPDMGADGIREFIKWYYGQIRKEGLIVDVRSNGGGNVSQMLIERLRRELLGVTFSRTNEDLTTYPSAVFHGHMVCLLNENSASDGDIFSAMFRRAGLGPLIGKRSWGGVVGITNRGPLIDGGSVFVPEFGNASANGSWEIEGYGVDPDIVVENDPQALIAGRDPQLERALEEVLKAMQERPRSLPARPPDPVKTP